MITDLYLYCCRHFHLVLHRISLPLYSSDLKIYAIDGNNNERVVDFTPVIYHGFLAGLLFLETSFF